ncbi:3-deoxy-D-manno-octulosonic acid transferase [Desulfomicrobium sp. ZS1]|uniref:3-deoxy-D-manno-octulosonic acid transferase n=1 Tax=Desulfomicrobium sp. ZS1 TaxID=2952228 RepID=UPI0020B442A2|nr:glycosyltransferase N-terminal domain-containing protein [Desulfomicrobium sp. ZS1]UTF49333.1 3-deoxy-D-manno-octulosonic acid transferase [Desulfomicrobium sp. ZS1]
MRPRLAQAEGLLFGQLFGLAYTLLWCLAGPLAFFSPRMRQGWKERLGLGKPAPCEIWVQGASAGECALVASLLEHLPDVPVLVTTCTSQGLDVLNRINSPSLQARMIPLDLPLLMGRMLDAAKPKAVILLETEIWPGLLMACAARGVPVIVVNARMTAKSLAGYLFLGPLLRLWAPQRIGAMAPADALRFGLIFGAQRTTVTGNIKFDRAMNTPILPLDENPLAGLVPRDHPFVVLGSVREQEEPLVLELIRQLREGNSHCVIGLFPRHMHRIPAWEGLLARSGIPFALRSALHDQAQPGSVVLWDAFGEMNPAYALASRAFVGGSLARLGGQNFLEPLAQGVLPCVGPHTRNFDWVGGEIFGSLVFKSASIPELARFLLSPAPPRSEVRAAALTYVHARQGATAASIALIRPYLYRSSHA